MSKLIRVTLLGGPADEKSLLVSSDTGNINYAMLDGLYVYVRDDPPGVIYRFRGKIEYPKPEVMRIWIDESTRMSDYMTPDGDRLPWHNCTAIQCLLEQARDNARKNSKAPDQ